MADDAIPMPPLGEAIPPEIAAARLMLAMKRDMPVQMIPASIFFQPVDQVGPDGKPQIAVIIDDPGGRRIVIYSHTSFCVLAENAQKAAGGPSLTVADLADLAALKDAQPFVEGGEK